MTNVERIMLREYPLVAKDETLGHAVRVMDKYDMDRAVVTKTGKVVGIITKKDIMMKLATLRTRSLTPGRLHVSSFMTPNPVTAKPTSSIIDVARIMLENNFGSIPIVGEEMEPLGLITRWEIANQAADIKLKAADLMISLPERLLVTNKLLHARQILLKYDVIFMPVMNKDGELVGYITIDEVADAFLAFHDIVPEKFRKERIEKLLVDDVMRLKPPVVDVDASINDIVRKIKERRSKGIVVVHRERVVGIVTLKEIVKAYVLYGTIEERT